MLAGEKLLGRQKLGIKPGHMPLDFAKSLIDEASDLGAESLQLSGGDPLMYPHLEELISHTKARNPNIFVFMNSVGTGVSDSRAKKIIDAGLGAWNFSIDTMNDEIYNSLRGVPDALRDVMTAVDTVKRAALDHPEFCVNMMTVITRHNFRELPTLVEYCLNNNFASAYFMNVYGANNGDLFLTVSEIQEFRNEIAPQIVEIVYSADVETIVKDNAKQVMATFFSDDNSDENYAIGQYFSSLEAAKTACVVPNYYGLIEPDGQVLPCCLVEISHEGVIGNARDDGLNAVWNSEKRASFNENRMEFCTKCSAPRHKTLGFVPKLCQQFND
jgi:radical SAM protein with 4Fe4S-binding SPASM domain